MLAKFFLVRLSAQNGVTITEYAFLFGLVLLLAFGGFQVLGGSISSLLGGSGQKASNSNTIQILNGNQTAAASTGGLGLKGSGYYGIGVNPATGQPQLVMVNGASATTSNVSSIDGSMMNSLGGAMLAKSLADLAAEQTEPILKNYYTQMATDAYYLAGAEGEIDNVPGLDLMPSGPNGETYTKGDGLNDIIKFSAELGSLMNNPPSQVNSAAFYQAMPLAVNAFNVSKQYENAYSRFIGPNGTVAVNFGLPSTCGPDGCPVGNGTPGSALLTASQAVSNPPGVIPMIHESYTQFESYSQIQSLADGVLAANKVASVQVASTIQDGQGLNTIAQTVTSALAAPAAPGGTTSGEPVVTVSSTTTSSTP